MSRFGLRRGAGAGSATVNAKSVTSVRTRTRSPGANRWLGVNTTPRLPRSGCSVPGLGPLIDPVTSTGPGSPLNVILVRGCAKPEPGPG